MNHTRILCVLLALASTTSPVFGSLKDLPGLGSPEAVIGSGAGVVALVGVGAAYLQYGTIKADKTGKASQTITRTGLYHGLQTATGFVGGVCTRVLINNDNRGALTTIPLIGAFCIGASMFARKFVARSPWNIRGKKINRGPFSGGWSFGVGYVAGFFGCGRLK